MTWADYYRAYRCRVCRGNCINHVDDSATKYGECRDCHRIPDLDQAPRTGEGGRGSTGASATSAGSDLPAGSEGLPLDPEAGPHRAATGRPTSGGSGSGWLSVDGGDE